jgi:hypothetical protein
MSTTMARKTSRWLWAASVIAIASGCGSTSDDSSTSNGSAGSTTAGDDGGTTTSDGASTGPGDDGSSAHDGNANGGDGAAPTGNNVTPVVVNAGPPAAGGSVDVPFISVTFCIPGTTTCETIDSIAVDTGSSGLRVLASALPSGFTLPQQNATTGKPLVECMEFGDGFTWGSVRSADVKIAGEMAANIPVQLIGDPGFPTIPSDCSSSGPEEDTVATFGSNGIIGINQIIPDCGDYCTTAQGGGYYSCNGGTCSPVGVTIANQLPNPIAAFASDDNGAYLQFPAVPADGAPTLTGSLVFGIGTQSNNALGAASVQTVDGDGNFTTIFNGKTLAASYIDSGTNSLSFDDSAIPECASDLAGWFCPPSLVTLSAQNKGLNGVTTTVPFRIESTETLFGGSNTAFDDLGGPAGDATVFAWGFPFFIGRTVFVALDGKSTPGGMGPYVAY